MEQLERISIQTPRLESRREQAALIEEKSAFRQTLDKWKEKLKLPEGQRYQKFPWKSLSVRNLLIGASALLILLAAYLNLRFASSSPAVDEGEGEDLVIDTGTTEFSEDDYFAVAVINRSRVRDEAIDMYQAVADDEAATQTSRDQAYASMNALVDRTAAEVDIENRIKAKGFSNCIAVLEDNRANIIVEAEGLTDAQVAQISEIVYLQAGVVPQNLTITEKV